MRLFLFDFSSPLAADVARELRKRGHEIAYWTGCKDHFERLAGSGEFPKTIFHSTFDAILAKPPKGADIGEVEPVGDRVKKIFAEHETIALAMMNRADFTSMSFSAKQQLYYGILGYWLHVLKEKKPDAMIFIDIPHAIYNFIAYIVAKHLGIKTIMFQLTRLPDRLLITSDYRLGSDHVRHALQQNNKEPIALESLSEDIQQYLREQFDEKAEPTPFDKKELDEKGKRKRGFFPPMSKIWKNLANGKILQTTVAYLRAYHNTEGRMLSIADNTINYKHKRYQKKPFLTKMAWKKAYEHLAQPFETTQPFVYVPLHYQPENSTSPAGGMFVDQIQMVRLLSAALPPGWRLLVKEHTSQWNPLDVRAHLGRYDGYYEALSAIPHVTLVDADTSSFKLINAARAVVTVTGTAGWEALLRGKPAIIFGSAWYMHAEGVLSVNDFSSVCQAMRDIADGFAPDRQALLRYIKILDDVCVKGFQQQTIFQRVSRIPYDQNVQNLAEALHEELGQSSSCER